MEYDPDFVIRGLHIDINKVNTNFNEGMTLRERQICIVITIITTFNF